MIAVMLPGPTTMLLVPYLDSLWSILVVLSVAASMGWTASALNFALVTDLVRNQSDIGEVTSITVLGGNLFGIMGPIVTGYVLQITGSFNATFAVAGTLALLGAACTLTLTRQPIAARPNIWQKPLPSLNPRFWLVAAYQDAATTNIWACWRVRCLVWASRERLFAAHAQTDDI